MAKPKTKNAPKPIKVPRGEDDYGDRKLNEAEANFEPHWAMSPEEKLEFCLKEHWPLIENLVEELVEAHHCHGETLDDLEKAQSKIKDLAEDLTKVRELEETVESLEGEVEQLESEITSWEKQNKELRRQLTISDSLRKKAVSAQPAAQDPRIEALVALCAFEMVPQKAIDKALSATAA